MNHNEIKARLLQAESAEDAAAIVKENGVELSTEQAARLFEEIKARRAAEANPLDATELDAVSGGMYERRLDGVCKATVEGSMVRYDENGNVTGFHTTSWCWLGTDYCKFATESYDGINKY